MVMNKIWKYVIGIGFGTVVLLTTANRLSELNKEGESVANLHYHSVHLKTGYVWKEAYNYIANPSLYPRQTLMADIYNHNQGVDFGKLNAGSEANLPCDGGENCPVLKDKRIVKDLGKMRDKGEDAINMLKKK